LVPVILSGGSGTRLWPLSRESHPKQFLPLVGDHSMLQQTWLRLRGLAGADAPLVVANEEHRFLVAEQLRQVGATPSALHPRTGRSQHGPGDCRGGAAGRGQRTGPVLLVLPPTT
jgi:mannose-1-phosphate guanylyltransferase/mannose-6-phosphate isomerase